MCALEKTREPSTRCRLRQPLQPSLSHRQAHFRGKSDPLHGSPPSQACSRPVRSRRSRPLPPDASLSLDDDATLPPCTDARTLLDAQKSQAMQSPLAAAFDYPVRSDSLARKKHAQHPSASSIASSSSSSNAGAGLGGGLGRGRGRGHAQTHAHGYSSSSAHTRSSSIATDLTTASSSYGADYGSPSGSKSRPFMLDDDDDDDVEECGTHAQVGEGEEDEQLPRTDSTLLLRERTRYRSSASYAPPLATTYPLQGAFGSLSISSSAAVSQEEYEADDAQLGSSENAHLELLAALVATSTTLDTCFCGSAPEEDSIYCSRACAQADALNALCGGGGSGSASSGGDEDGAGSSDAASLRSYQSSSNASCLSSGAESSHYRRVEKEETRRATEKERALRRLKSSHRKPVPKQHGFETTTSSNASPSASRPTSSSRALPALRTASSRSRPRSPATASSQRSSSSCLPPSPLRDSIPSPCIVEPDSASPREEEDAPQGLGFEQFRPCTPSPRIGASSQNKDGSMLVSDIYASYLSATPRDGHQNLLQTPTSHPLGASSAPHTLDSLAATPRAMYLAQGGQGVHRDDNEEDEESPTQHCGNSNVGLRMLELCDSDDDEDASDRRGRGKNERESHQQHYDEARDSLSESGWAGGHRMQQRMAERTSSSSRASDRSCSPASSSAAAGRMYGHMRGKLSFDDVVGILGA